MIRLPGGFGQIPYRPHLVCSGVDKPTYLPSTKISPQSSDFEVD